MVGVSFLSILREARTSKLGFCIGHNRDRGQSVCTEQSFRMLFRMLFRFSVIAAWESLLVQLHGFLFTRVFVQRELCPGIH